MSERLPHSLRKVVRERQHFRCAICGGEHPPGSAGCISVHHIRPKSKKGSDDPGNLVGLCRGEGSNECHDKVDYLTLEHDIKFEQIMSEGLDYYLDQYPHPRFAAQESAVLDRENPARTIYPDNNADGKSME